MKSINDGLNRLKQMPGTITPEFALIAFGAHAIDPNLFDVVIAIGRCTGDVKIDRLRARAAVRRSR